MAFASASASVALASFSSSGGGGAGRRLSLPSLASSGFTSDATSAAANTGRSVTFFSACSASFSSSHARNSSRSFSIAAFSSSGIQGLDSAKPASVSLAAATNSRAFATAAGRLTVSLARLIHSSPVACSPSFFASNSDAEDSAPSMYSQSSASASSAANASRCASSVTARTPSSSSTRSRIW